MASMQRSASSVGDAFTEAVASASRSVGAFGLEREIASYESKIRARKRQFGVEAYGPLRAADRQALALVFNAVRADVSALQAVIDRKRAALAALRDSATPQPARDNGDADDGTGVTSSSPWTDTAGGGAASRCAASARSRFDT